MKPTEEDLEGIPEEPFSHINPLAVIDPPPNWHIYLFLVFVMGLGTGIIAIGGWVIVWLSKIN